VALDLVKKDNHQAYRRGISDISFQDNKKFADKVIMTIKSGLEIN
jgi:hypothetical protein